MKLLQLNLNHCVAEQDLLAQSVQELRVDVAILSEQYKNLDTQPWEADATGRAAIWFCGRRPFQETMTRRESGFVWVKVDGIYLYSCYASPNDQLEDFIYRLVSDARGRSPVIIAGDFNAWAVDWGSVETNTRGRLLLEVFSSLDLALLNDGELFTFRRA